MRRSSPPRELVPCDWTGRGLGRALVLVAGLLAASCSHKSRAPAAEESAAAGAAAVSAIPGMQPVPGETVVASDVNADGRPDLWRYSVLVGEGKERLVRKERELNGDGRIDSWETFDEEGKTAKHAYDLDFDGKPDLVITYEKGQLVKKEYSAGFDGLSRVAAFYENGKLVRKERDQRGTGKVDTWEYFEAGELDRIGTDLDGDGEVDTWEKRPGAEQPGGTPAPPADK